MISGQEIFYQLSIIMFVITVLLSFYMRYVIKSMLPEKYNEIVLDELGFATFGILGFLIVGLTFLYKGIIS